MHNNVIIQRELATSGSLLGYRAMWNRLSTSYGLTVRRLVIYRIMNIQGEHNIDY